MFQPNASSPISLAWNATGGGRNRLPLSSMMRIVTSGAAWSRSAGQTPSASKRRIEPSRSATVRPSGRVSGRPMRQVEKPSRASASAAAAPTAPAPTTATSKGAGIAVLSTRVQRRDASVGDARGEAHDGAPQALAQEHVADRPGRPALWRGSGRDGDRHRQRQRHDRDGEPRQGVGPELAEVVAFPEDGDELRREQLPKAGLGRREAGRGDHLDSRGGSAGVKWGG